VIVSRRALLAGAALWSSARTARADGEVDALLARIAKARAPLRTLQGPFAQTRTIGLLATDVRSRGTLWLVRPDRMRWDLAPPDDVTFWVGPRGMAYRSAHGHGSLSATSARVGAGLDDLRAVLGGDLAKLQERWSLRVLRDDDSGVELEGTARSPGPTPIRSMRFSLAPDLVRPTRAMLVEGARDRTAIDFGPLRVDAPIDDATMRPPSE
jgi:Outer membrane lipoprotein carrier protein LolA